MFSGLEHMSSKEIENTNKVLRSINPRKRQLMRPKDSRTLWGPGGAVSFGD